MAQSWWDDFSNNLATDLAPLVALLGEAPTKQYLSECITLEDIIIFATAPLGIITAIVSAIRVCGTPSLRAFVGRAQEGAGTAEAELCSSTSRDVCELYNNGGIARVFGRPKLLEIIHNPKESFEEFFPKDGTRATAGIHLFQDYINTERGRKEWRLQQLSGIRSRKHANDPRMDISFAPNPNLSLNIGIKPRNRLWFIAAAALGVSLQLFVLVWAALSRYYYQWTRNSSEDDYAIPMTVIGTISLCFGIGLCAHLIEKTTEERVFQRVGLENPKKPTSSEKRAFGVSFGNFNSSGATVSATPGTGRINDQNLDHVASSNDTRMYWVQPGNQRVGDQIFDPFAYSDNVFPLQRYMTSWKNTKRESSNMAWIWTASATSLIGFVFQFLGLRACHSSVAVAQFGATILMSLVRASLRTQRLRPEDNLLKSHPDSFQGNELDFLALNIAQANTSRSRNSDGDQLLPVWWVVNASPWGDFHPGAAVNPSIADAASDPDTDRRVEFNVLERLPSVSSARPTLFGFRIKEEPENRNRPPGSDKSLTQMAEEELSLWKQSECCIEHETKCVLEASGNDCKHDINAGMKTMFYRGRLADLTGLEQPKSEHSSYWGGRFVPVRETAIALGLAIEDTMKILFDSHPMESVSFSQSWEQAFSIFWTLRCSFRERPTAADKYSDIHMSLRRAVDESGVPKGPWKADHSEIESVLGLWSWSLKSLHIHQDSLAGEPDISRILSAHRDMESASGEKVHLDIWREANGGSQIQNQLLGVEVSNIDVTQHGGDNKAKDRRNHKAKKPTMRCIQNQNACFWRIESLEVGGPIALKADSNFGHPAPVRDGAWVRQLFGWSNVMAEEVSPQNTLVVSLIGSKDPVLLNCAQEIYSIFLSAAMQIVKDIGKSFMVKPRQSNLTGTASNEIIKRIQNALISRRLCDEESAFACTIPVLKRQGLLKLPDGILEMAGELADKHRSEKKWVELKKLLHWMHRHSFAEFDARHTDEDPAERMDAFNSIRLSILQLCETYRTALMQDDDQESAFGYQGILGLLDQHSEDEVFKSMPLVWTDYGRAPIISESSSRPSTPNSLELMPRISKWSLTTAGSSTPNSAESSSRPPTPRISKSSSRPDNLAETMRCYGEAAWWQLCCKSSLNAQQQQFQIRFDKYFSSQKGTRSVSDSCIQAMNDLSSTLYLLKRQPPNDWEKFEPLIQASQIGWYMVIKALKPSVEIINQADRHRRTALSYASELGDINTVRTLISAGATLRQNTNIGGRMSPLHYAAKEGRAVIIMDLLDKWPDNYDEDAQGFTPLNWAITSGNIEAVRPFLAIQGDKWNMFNSYHNRRPPLHLAIKEGNMDMVAALLEIETVDPNLSHNKNIRAPPLTCALRLGNEQVFDKILKSNKINPDIKDQDGRSTLWWAAALGLESYVRNLMGSGKVYHPQSADVWNDTPLSIAAQAGHLEVVRLLVARIGPAASFSFEAILVAAKNGHLAVVQELLPLKAHSKDVARLILEKFDLSEVWHSIQDTEIWAQLPEQSLDTWVRIDEAAPDAVWRKEEHWHDLTKDFDSFSLFISSGEEVEAS